MELSQLSAWTGESVFNVKTQETISKKKRQNTVDEIYKTGMPDREEMVDTIINLRQAKNCYEDQIRILKVTCARLQKSLYIAQEQLEKDNRADWIKHSAETASGAKNQTVGLKKPMDLEAAMHEITRLKRDINTLLEEQSYLKVQAEKYQKRSIYVRKKYTELTTKTKTSNVITMEQTQLDSKLRIKCNKLQDQIKKLNEQMQKKNEDMALLRQKTDGSI